MVTMGVRSRHWNWHGVCFNHIVNKICELQNSTGRRKAGAGK
jgi:hypothetical protein